MAITKIQDKLSVVGTATFDDAAHFASDITVTGTATVSQGVVAATGFTFGNTNGIRIGKSFRTSVSGYSFGSIAAHSTATKTYTVTSVLVAEKNFVLVNTPTALVDFVVKGVVSGDNEVQLSCLNPKDSSQTAGSANFEIMVLTIT